MNNFTNALGIDVGSVRIGVARVNAIARLPEPLCVLKNDGSFQAELNKLINEYDIDLLVIGLPRNMSGQETKQSEYVKAFVNEYLAAFSTPHVFQDETLSTVGAKDRMLSKSDGQLGIDAHAAAIILDDFLATQS